MLNVKKCERQRERQKHKNIFIVCKAYEEKGKHLERENKTEGKE